MSMSSTAMLARGTSARAISAAGSHAVTVAPTSFAHEHGIPPGEVAGSLEYAAGLFERAPTAEELAIINAA